MHFRIRVALGLAVLLGLAGSFSASAKGGFSFVTITGTDVGQVVRVTDPALTKEYFAFADFYRDRIGTPIDPGTGYEITRFYTHGALEVAFDRLHYYPHTGYVYYDGIENGDSEYDGEWYRAGQDVKSVFENALGLEPIVDAQAVEAIKPSNVATVGKETQPVLPIVPVLVGFGLAMLFIFAFSRRRVSPQ